MADMRTTKLQLTTLDASAKTDDIVALMKRDGAAILRDAIPAMTVEQMLREVGPYVEGTPMGGDDFTGHRTQRTGALVARTPTCRKPVMDPAVLAAAESFLSPYAMDEQGGRYETVYNIDRDFVGHRDGLSHRGSGSETYI